MSSLVCRGANEGWAKYKSKNTGENASTKNTGENAVTWDGKDKNTGENASA